MRSAILLSRCRTTTSYFFNDTDISCACKQTSGYKTYLAGVDANMDCGAVGLFTLNALDVNNILLSVDLDNFANLLAFVVSPDNLVMREE